MGTKYDLKLLTTYELISYYSKNKKEYIELFSPFVLSYLQTYSEGQTFEAIQAGILNEYILNIPLHPLRSIINNLSAKKFISIHEDKTYGLTQYGFFEAVNTMQDLKEVNKKLHIFFNDVMIFLSDTPYPTKDIKETREVFLEFILKNVDVLIYFTNSNAPITFDNQDYTRERYLCDYAIKIRDNPEKEKCYTILKELILAATKSLVFNKKFSVNKESMDCDVFIDTNILFYILGFHHSEFTKPALELHDLITKKWNLKIKVFEFTVSEVTRVLSNCVDNYDIYIEEIDVDSICQYLKKTGKSKEEIMTIKDNIDNIIKKLDIEIIPSDFGFEKYDKEYIETLVRDLYNYKIKYKGYDYEHEYERREISRYHDIAAILKIKEIRKHRPMKLEISKAIFLTADQPLSMFDYEYNFLKNPSHSQDDSFPEVIVDRLLTNILFLKDPSSDISIESLIANCARNRYMNAAIYQATLKHIHNELPKEDAQNTINAIIKHQQFKEILGRLTERDIPKIGELLENTKKSIIQEKRETREKEEREAREKLEREAREKLEFEAKEKLEREAREKLEREANEKLEREANEKLEREANEKLEREAKEKPEPEAKKFNIFYLLGLFILTAILFILLIYSYMISNTAYALFSGSLAVISFIITVYYGNKQR